MAGFMPALIRTALGVIGRKGSKSFRFSISEPPLQQMPKRDEKLTPLIRGVFLPEEGQVWAELDT
jgi:hypothetical protein